MKRHAEEKAEFVTSKKHRSRHPQTSYQVAPQLSDVDRMYSQFQQQMAQQALRPPQIPQIPTTVPTINGRTVYIGNLSPLASMSDLMDIVAGGAVEHAHVVPDKQCAFISYVDSFGALLFHQHALLNSLNIRDQQIKVGWSKTSVPIATNVASAIVNGATRCLYIGNVDNIHEHLPAQLVTDFMVYGLVDCVRIISEKSCILIHMLSIQYAMAAMAAIKTVGRFTSCRIRYGKDRCDRGIQGQKSMNIPLLPKIAPTLNSLPMPPCLQALLTAVPRDQRVIYIGGLPEGTTAEDICLEVKAGGPLLYVKIAAQQKCAFLSFVKASTAAMFHFYCNVMNGGLVIKKQRITNVAWAKNMFIPRVISDALLVGASRSIFISNIDLNIVTREMIRLDFSEFGTIEQICTLQHKNTVFVNFCSIGDAVKAMNAISSESSTMSKYKTCKVTYGKDRCSDEPNNMPIVILDYLSCPSRFRSSFTPQPAVTLSAPPKLFAQLARSINLPR